ncbi:MAG TPA: hypothetical protein VIV66_11285 [Pyrinomonadaceae bacterium]
MSAAAGQREAEVTASRAMKRFYETLDYAVIWKEFYVTEGALRDFEVEAMTSSLVSYRAEGLSPHRLSKDSRERAFIAMRNYWALISALEFTTNKKVPESIKPLYESITERQTPYATSDELDTQFTAVMDRMSDTLRKLVVPQNVDSKAYKLKMNQFVETNPATREDMNEVFAPAGLSRDVKVYTVQRESFHLYLIEENGQYKILSVLSRIKD